MPERLGTAKIFFDEDELSALVGQQVRADRLRHKPGLSTFAALTWPDGDQGWALALSANQQAKAENAFRRANRFEKQISVVQLGNYQFLFGRVDTDPVLSRAHHRARKWLVEKPDLVRYNPGRRVIYRVRADGQDLALRLHAKRGEGAELMQLAAYLAEEGVAVNTAFSVGKRLSVWPWLAGSDLLLDVSDRALSARLAGEELRKLHRLTVGEPARPMEQLRKLCSDLEYLDPALGRSLGKLVARARFLAADQVSSHGDFSADQVLVGQRVWLLDFDRFCLAPRGLDIASFHAVEILSELPPATDQLIAGYGMEPDWRPWVFFALACRVLEPFRSANPNWRDLIDVRLNQLKEWL